MNVAFAIAMPDFRNRILAALPGSELERITPHLELIALETGMVAYDPERPISHVYFVETGVISIVSLMADGSAIETATIGNEGMIGIALFHGVDTATEQAFVQVPGEGYRMSAAAFREVIAECPTLQRLLHRCSLALFTFAAQCSGCNRVHTMEQRCARWLLMVHDRIVGDEFHLTQHFLSQMLGVRRATVSETASELQKAGLIRYVRGRVTVIDRAGLERACCECYGIITSAFARILEQRRVPSPLEELTISEGGKSIAGEGAPTVPHTVDAQ